jgi:hypothetical protein
MASYESYKTVKNEQFIDGTVTEDKLGTDVRHRVCTKWLIGEACRCSPGCCCLWTVPACTRKVYFELWGAGGNGSGACSCNRCHHYQGAGGGSYSTKMVTTAPGCTYRMCAGGVYPCLSRECSACNGCISYVCGFNACNLCTVGGRCGNGNDNWTEYCFSCWGCCIGPGCSTGNADFTMISHTGHFSGIFNCHCHHQYVRPTNAPFLGGNVSMSLAVCWSRCGCWIAPPGHGGQGAMSSYCGSSCCSQGGTGGPGVVKLTFT